MISPRRGFAVDIDNVLCGAEAEVQRLFREVTGTEWPRGTYGSAGGLDSSDLGRSMIEEIFIRFHEESIPKLPVLPGAKPALTWLQQYFRIIIVTARRPYSRPQTLRWLTEHGLPFDALYHTEEKDEIGEPLVAAIDDHPHHIQNYVNLGVRVFVMDQPWNRLKVPSDVIRVSGWDALLKWLTVRDIKDWSNWTPNSSSPADNF